MKKIVEILKNNVVNCIIMILVTSSVIVIAGNVIVKQGNVVVDEDLNVTGNVSANGVICDSTGCIHGNTGGARVYTNVSQNMDNETWTKIPLNNIDFDKRNEFYSSDSLFNVSEDGYYLVAGSIAFESVAGDKQTVVGIYVNGVVMSKGMFHTSVGAHPTPFVQDVYYLNKNDYIELWGWQSTGQTLTLRTPKNETWMTVYQLD